MFTYLKGMIVDVGDVLTIDAGGVGYEVYVSQGVRDKVRVGEVETIFVHLDIKETAHTLYGFSGMQERELFRALIGVNGVGAKSALALLGLGAQGVVSAVASGNSLALSKIKGVGTKLADKVVLDLRGKILKKFGAVAGEGLAQEVITSSEVQDAIYGLVSLGVPRNRAVEIVGGLDTIDKSAEDIIVEALAKR